MDRDPPAPSGSELTSEERSLVEHQIAGILDNPSVYMGGPSRNARAKAETIVEALERSGRLRPSPCIHAGWETYRQHGIYCPDCGATLPEKKPDASC